MYSVLYPVLGGMFEDRRVSESPRDLEETVVAQDCSKQLQEALNGNSSLLGAVGGQREKCMGDVTDCGFLCLWAPFIPEGAGPAVGGCRLNRFGEG